MCQTTKFINTVLVGQDHVPDNKKLCTTQSRVKYIHFRLSTCSHKFIVHTNTTVCSDYISDN
jgi:hypothetical protein